MELKLYLNKNVEENASRYFEEGKKARKKIDGVKRTLNEFSTKKVKKEEAKVSVKRLVSSKKRWYEKFRWFITSEGFLVIGGRDATSNEIVVKKHTEEGDVVFHTDMAGSPFIIIKPKNKDDVKEILGEEFVQASEVGDASMVEAASYCFAHSRSWKLGLQTADVFHVKPEQCVKESGLAKGSFMIRGETKYVDPVTDYGVGIIGEHVVGGPLSTVSKWSKVIVQIEQGKDKSSAVAKLIRTKFMKELEIDASVDDIINVLPAGGCQVKKERKTKAEALAHSKRKKK